MIEVDFIDLLDRFNLALKKNSTEIYEGEQQSDRTGQGMIFEDHKKYVPGDDLRKMDWKAYARTDEFYIKRFEQDNSVTVHILVDRSSSMDYGEPNKFDYAAKLGLATAYMTGKTNDRFRLSVFSETITDISSARRNPNMGEIVDTLNSLRKTPESLVERCITEYSNRIENKSVVIVISDFLTDVEQIESALKRLKNSEVVLVNTLDSSEIEPEMHGDKILKDPESDEKLRTYLSKRVRNKYQDQMTEHTQAIEEAAQKYGARYLLVSTGDDFFNSFMALWQAVNQD